MPNHVEIRFFLGVKSSSNCIRESASYHETPENWRCLTDNGRNDSQNQPAHNEIKGKAEFLIDLFSKDFIEDAKDGRSPLNGNNEISKPVIHQSQYDWRIRACDSHINHRMVDDSQDVFVGRTIGHRVVNG